MIKILDYNCGNISALKNAFNRINIETEFIKTPEDFSNTSKIVLPGVGSFDSAIKKLNNSGLRGQLEKKVLIDKIPVLGICVGMQIFGNISDEGNLRGLGWLNYDIEKIYQNDNNSPLPHMGWNNVEIDEKSMFFDKNFSYEFFYFLHSFCLKKNNQNNSVNSKCFYNHEFISIVEYENIYGIQFHPEKSHEAGLSILSKFNSL